MDLLQSIILAKKNIIKILSYIWIGEEALQKLLAFEVMKLDLFTKCSDIICKLFKCSIVKCSNFSFHKCTHTVSI